MHCNYFAASLVIKPTFLTSYYFLMLKRNFKLLENTIYVFNKYDIIFHATSDANDVIKVEFTKLQQFTTVFRLKMTFLLLRKSALSSRPKCADIV